MNILLTNDDGVFAPGLAVLARKLAVEHKVTVVAPAEEQSGKSRAITLYRSLALRRVSIPAFNGEVYSLDGTPADCVRVGLTYLLQEPETVDLVLAGINRGINVANDVPYSGTVSAAMEALHFGKSSIAVSALSLNGKTYFQTAADVISHLLQEVPPAFLGANLVLNVNTPFCLQDEVKGYKVLESTMRVSDCYELVGRVGDEEHIRIANRYPKNADAHSDLSYLRQQYVTLSPLVDHCRADGHVELVEHWIK